MSKECRSFCFRLAMAALSIWCLIDATNLRTALAEAQAALPVERPHVVKPSPGVSLRCQVVGVVDGDTLEVEVIRRVRVRLLDCWAPESRTTDAAEKKAGLAAKVELSAAAVGKRATLFVPTDAASRVGDVFTFDRVLGHVWVEGLAESLSEHQVRLKHAATAKGNPVGQ
ncbi:thermonuclease family protein [Lacipirellula sp.]|uniref:thermonuclease family protein n=1 Tax=Lacipirellula sp. TaxID=2691419 RepID=UPI003D13F28D